MAIDERGLIGDDEHDIVECTDDEGNTLLLEVMEYFFYNGDEYAVLMDSASECDHEDCDEERDMYIMKVLNSISPDGEEMEEFIPVDEDQLDRLVEIVQSHFDDDEIVIDDEVDDDDDDYDDDDDDDEYDYDDEYDDDDDDN